MFERCGGRGGEDGVERLLLQFRRAGASEAVDGGIDGEFDYARRQEEPCEAGKQGNGARETACPPNRGETYGEHATLEEDAQCPGDERNRKQRACASHVGQLEKRHVEHGASPIGSRH